MSEGKMNRKSTSVVIRDDQSAWIKKNHLNFSNFVRYLIDEEINRRDLIHDRPIQDDASHHESTISEECNNVSQVPIRPSRGEQGNMKEFCNGLIIEFMLDDMADLKQHIYDGKLKMIRTDDPNEWEEQPKGL